MGKKTEKAGAKGAAAEQAAHTSAEYADALEACADIFDAVVDAVPGFTQFKVIGLVNDAIPFVRRAAKAMRRAAWAMPDLAPVVDPLVQQAPGAVQAMGDAVTKAGDAMADAASSAVHAVADPMKAGLAARQAAKDRAAARKTIIQAASMSIPQAKFAEQRTAHLALVSGGRFPGCYAIVRTGKGFARDLSDFQDVYVGASGDMWAAVAGELAGDGNPDVYADAKYEAGVQILLYPCQEEQLEELKRNLIVALDADVSYNARELAR